MKKLSIIIISLFIILSLPFSVFGISDSATYISASTNKDQAKADGSDQIKITAKFSGGSSEPGSNKDAQIEFAVAGGTDNKISPSNILLTNVDGYATAYLSSTSSGQKTITAIAKTVENDNPELTNSTETRIYLNVTFTPISTSQDESQNKNQTSSLEFPVLEKILVGSREYSPENLNEAEITTRTKLALKGKANPETLINIFLFSKPIEGTTKSDQDGNWEYSLRELEEGEHKLQLATTDQQGNISEKTEPITFRVKKAGETIDPTENKERKSWLPQNKAFYLFATLFIIVALLITYLLIKKYRPNALKKIIRKF